MTQSRHVFCIALGFKCSLTDKVETWFQFAVLMIWLKSAISRCKCTFKCHCSGVAGSNALLGHQSWVAGGLGTRFYVKVFMEFVLQNTVALTTVYILIVFYNKNRLVIIHISFLLLLSLSRTCCSRLCKVCSVLMIVFHKCYYIECIFFFMGVCVCVCVCVYIYLVP
jgi:hypothetical protein